MSVPNIFTLRLQNMEPESVNVEHEPVPTSPTTASDGNQDISPPSPHLVSVEPEPEVSHPRNDEEQTPPTLLGKALQYVDGDGNNLLHIAIRLNDNGMVHDLLAYGIDPFAKNKKGESPFDIVFRYPNYDNRNSMAHIRGLMWDHIKGN